MIIKGNKKVYVQKSDIGFLNYLNGSIPENILLKAFKNETLTNSNRYDFVEFDKKSEIQYFRKYDLLDYDDIRDLSDEELNTYLNEVAKLRNKLATFYNSMPEKERKKHDEFITMCDILENKLYNIKDFLYYKRGFLHMDFPKDIPESPKKKVRIFRMIDRIKKH